MAFEKEQIEKMGITYVEGMTDEQVYQALANVRGEKDKAIKERTDLKASFDKTASELAELKKKGKESQTDAEKQAELIAELQKQNADMKKNSTIRDIKDNYKGLGYDDKTADDIAKAQFDGDYETVTKLTKEFMAKHDEALKQELMKGTPDPKKGDPNVTVPKTQEEFNKLTYSQLIVLQEEHPAVYAQFTKKK